MTNAMDGIPQFGANGSLPAGDYELTFRQLRESHLVVGCDAQAESPWDQEWRAQLVDNLEVLTGQLWAAGIEEVFIDGSFVEDKAHPNDIDGYFVCGLEELARGELERGLNQLDPHKIWTWSPESRRPIGGIRNGNCRCGTVTVSSFIRIHAIFSSPAGFAMSWAMSWSFRRPFGGHGSMAHRVASSSCSRSQHHDSE